jgi:polyphosphate kinase
MGRKDAGQRKRDKPKGGRKASAAAQPPEASYAEELRALQIELVKLQRDVIAGGERVLVIVEGRDAAGKDGTIKRFTEHMSPRETRVVSLGKPTERESGSWYYQRYIEHLPSSGEIVFFNRSWYNRAGVERVMGFCSPEQTEEFLDTVVALENLLVRSGLRLFKYYLDIARAEQKRRLAARLANPLKRWKVGPIDRAALKHWDAYTEARDAMLARTHSPAAPWAVVRADQKPAARLAVLRDFLLRQDYRGKRQKLLAAEPDVLARYDPGLLAGWLAD